MSSPGLAALPAEIWVETFRALRARDLAALCRVSRFFHALAGRRIFHDVAWTRADALRYALDAYTQDRALLSVTRSLDFAIWPVYVTAIFRLDAHGVPDVVRVLHREGSVEIVSVEDLLAQQDASDGQVVNLLSLMRPRLYPDPAFYDEIVNTAAQFTQLRQLTFHDTALPPNALSIIHGFPNLRVLTIKNCVLPYISAGTPILDHSSLRLTHLVLWHLCSLREIQDGPVFYPRTAHQFYTLMCCPTLRHLELDIQRDEILCRLFMQQAVPDIFNFPRPVLPARLEKLTFRIHKRQEGVGDMVHTSKFLKFLLGKCLYLREFEVVDGDGDLKNLLGGHLLELRRYRGPAQHASSILSGCDHLEHLELLELLITKDTTPSGVLNSLQDLNFPLQTLVMMATHWEDELLLAVGVTFPALRSVIIEYCAGEPSEDQLMSAGPEVFALMPMLETVRLLPPRRSSRSPGLMRRWDKSCANDHALENELREYAIVWGRFCPRLREVQLRADYTWVKLGDVWTTWSVKMVDGVRVTAPFVAPPRDETARPYGDPQDPRSDVAADAHDPYSVDDNDIRWL